MSVVWQKHERDQPVEFKAWDWIVITFAAAVVVRLGWMLGSLIDRIPMSAQSFIGRLFQ